MASFNAYYSLYSEPVNDKSKIENYLEEIKRPAGDEGWTELYSSIFLAADDFKQLSGSKALIVLSDGENEPYYKNTGKPQRDFGKKDFDYRDDIEKCLREGETVFVINYGSDTKDSGLKTIARETGGTVFDASSPDELKNVYSTIKERILNEFLITYKAGMEPSDKKFVKVEMETAGSNISSTRFYYSSIIFGLPSGKFNPLIPALVLVSLLLLWILSLIKFKNSNKKPLLEILDAPLGTIVTRTLNLTKGETIIGSSPRADFTIHGSKKSGEEFATIVYDEKTKIYAVKSKQEIMVNNKPVKTRVLEPGDVINTGGVTIVFDEGERHNGKKRK
jgi:hypothetical protein